ncbi:hypothetical protein GGF46_002176 [Coemansia sp. RSA 552]|nr:hypothetical protein GGF46_002176 [Coemansia sp. RSA 552]
MRGFVSLALLVGSFLANVALGDTEDYESFMSSLSYNWQNQFSDLRYQVDHLQKVDPQKYDQLAAELGLKPGTKISVPSQYSPKWASKFVDAAQLYTPPAATHATDDLEVATPTAPATDDAGGSLTELVHFITTLDKDNDDDDDDDDKSGGDDKGDKQSSKSRDHSQSKDSSDQDESDDEGLDDAEEAVSTSTQFGNPVVGSFDGERTPVVPTGQGYSAATAVAPHLAALLLAMACLAIH